MLKHSWIAPFSVLCSTLIASANSHIELPPQLPPEPTLIIFDTDMGNDVDDVMALSVIHALEDRQQCKLLAVTVTKDHELAGPFVDLLNTFYGRPDIPIATVRNGATPAQGLYLGLAKEKNEDGSLRYPHNLKSGSDAPEATRFLRKLLTEQADQSVTLIQVGFFTNFRRLLESEADDISPLNGRALIEQKVRLLSIMAGSFQTIHNNNHYIEYNVKKDIPSAQLLAEEWPTEIIWSGFEIGIAAAYPAESIERDYNYVPRHPIKEAYYLYDAPPSNRPTWDLTSVIAAVWADREYFGLSMTGRVSIQDDGFTRFTPNKNGGRDRYLTMTSEQAIRVKEALVQLSSHP